MATTSKFIIKGENQIGRAVKDASKDLNSLKKTADSVGKGLKTALGGLLVGVSVKAVVSGMNSAMKSFQEAERQYRKLALTLSDDKSYKSAVKTISTLSRQTLSSKGDVESMVAELAALGKSASEIDSISSASVALSNVTGGDLNSSMKTLLNSLNGNARALQRMGIDTSNLTKEQLKNGAAVDLVNKKFGELSKNLAKDSVQQSIKNISDTIGDIGQDLGGVVEFTIAPFVAKFDAWLIGFKDNLTSIFKYIGAIITNFPKIWSTILANIGTMTKALISDVADVVVGVLKALPSFFIDFGKGVLSTFAYWGASLYDSIYDAIANGIANAIEKVEGILPDWIKNLLHMDGGFRNTLRQGSDTASGFRKSASESFISAKFSFKEALSSALSSGGSFKASMKEVGAEIGTIIEPTLKAIGLHLDTSVYKPERGSGSNGGNAIVEPSAFQPIFDMFSQIKDFAQNPALAALQKIIEGFVEILSPAIDSVIAPIFDALKDIGRMFGSLFLPILDALAPIFQTIAQTMMTIIAPIIQLMTPFLSMIAGVLQVLNPLFVMLAQAITILMAPVQYLGDLFSWLGQWVNALGQNIGIALYNITHPFSMKGFVSGPGGFSSDAFSGLQGRIDAIGNNVGSYAVDSVSTTTAASSASYQGAMSVTINVYNSAPVVGNDGIRTFAQMIRNEFDALDYYGVSS